MELFRNLRVRAGMHFLAGRISRTPRKTSYTRFCDIKTIGITWDASKPEEFVFLSGFYQKMAEKNIEVSILGFFPGKVLPDQYTAIRFLKCLKPQELDFFYRPVSSEATGFISKKFDVLIDINFRDIFPLNYVVTMSKAGFKVGLVTDDPGSSPFDLMISQKNTVATDKYLDQVLIYLEMINSESERKAV